MRGRYKVVMVCLGLLVGTLVHGACNNLYDDCDPVLRTIPNGRYVQAPGMEILVDAELQLTRDTLTVLYETPEGHVYRVSYRSEHPPE